MRRILKPAVLVLLAMACMANTATATDEGKELKAKVYLEAV